MTAPEITLAIIFVVFLSVCGIYIARKRSNKLPTRPGNLSEGARDAEQSVAHLKEPRRG